MLQLKLLLYVTLAVVNCMTPKAITMLSIAVND